MLVKDIYDARQCYIPVIAAFVSVSGGGKAYGTLKTGGGLKKRRRAQRMPWNALVMMFSVYQIIFGRPQRFQLIVE